MSDTRRYIPALDGLRAIAAIAVVGFHAKIPGFTLGGIGVHIFFALSGFLITRILLSSLQSGRMDFWEFYRRRALRLLPAYVAVVLACVFLEPFSDVGGTLKGAATSFLYVSNWAAAFGVGLGSLEHTWTLSIEEQFYLVWPALFVWLAKTPHRASVILGLAGLSWALTLAATILDAPAAFIEKATPLPAIHLLAGCALAVLPRVSVGWIGPVALAGLVLAIGGYSPDSPLLAWPLIAVGTCAVILSAMEAGSVSTLLSWAPLVAIGKVSYGLYLWHFPILTHIDTQMGLETWGPKLLGLALTAAVVPLSYRYIEQPFLRMKDKAPPMAVAV